MGTTSRRLRCATAAALPPDSPHLASSPSPSCPPCRRSAVARLSCIAPRFSSPRSPAQRTILQVLGGYVRRVTARRRHLPCSVEALRVVRDRLGADGAPASARHGPPPPRISRREASRRLSPRLLLLLLLPLLPLDRSTSGAGASVSYEGRVVFRCERPGARGSLPFVREIAETLSIAPLSVAFWSCPGVKHID